MVSKRSLNMLSGRLDLVRDMAWFTPQRARVYAAAMAIACAGALAKLIWSLHGGYDSHGDLFGADYSSFWAASRLVIAGMPADVYVPTLHRLAELPVLLRNYAAFYYPPTYLILCAPLALLPFFPSLLFFLGMTGAAFLATIYRILRTRWAVLAALAFPVVGQNIIPGQNAFLTTAILGTGLTILDQRPRLAGAVLGLMVIKPHLALAVPIALVVSRRWTTLLYAGGTALGLVALATLIFGDAVWISFLANAHEARDTLEQGSVGFLKMQSAFALARSLGASVNMAYLLQCIVAAGALWALIRAQRQSLSAAMERSLVVLACLLVTPFLLFYDMMIIALPLAWMLREWLDYGFPPWSKLVALLVFCIPILPAIIGPMPFGLASVILLGAYLFYTAITRISPARFSTSPDHESPHAHNLLDTAAETPG